MTVVVTHTTPADGTFSAAGAAAWDADHDLSGLGTLAEQDANAVAITGGTINGVPLGTTTPAAGTFTTLTATGTSYLGGSSTSRSVQVDPVAGGTSTYTQFTRFVANNEQQIVAANTANLGLVATGGGGINMRTTASGQLQLRVADTSSAVNFVQVTGAATGGTPTISAQGSDANPGLNVSSKGTGSVNLRTNTGTQVQIQDATGLTVDRPWLMRGGQIFALASVITGYAPRFQASNEESIAFNTNSGTSGGVGGSTQFQIAHTASAVNFVQVTGAATGGAPTILAQGSDANVQINVLGKGTGFVVLGNNSRAAAAFTTTGSANNILITGTATTVAPSIAANGSDTNIDINLNSKGAGALNVNTGGGTQFRVVNTASAVNYFQANGSVTGVQPGFRVEGTDTNISTAFTTKGTGSHFFSTNGFAQTQLVVAHTASAVNYFQVNGAATGGVPTISAQGSDANVSIAFQPKGGGVVALYGSDALTQLRGASTSAASGNTFLEVQRANGFVDLMAASGVANGDIRLTPKGTGNVRFGTYTANMALTVQGYVEIKDSGGTIRRLAVIA
jgi:hypothetical protein